MRIARHEPGFYRVENTSKGRTYHIRIEKHSELGGEASEKARLAVSSEGDGR
jgi:hypothetical protein